MLLDGTNHLAVLTGDTNRLHAFYRAVFDAEIEARFSPEESMRLSFVPVGPQTGVPTAPARTRLGPPSALPSTG